MAYYSKKSNHCLVCLKQCDIRDTEEKYWEDCTCHADSSYLLGASFSFLNKSNDSIQHKLKYIFVLRKLLDYPEKRCLHYLNRCENEDSENKDGLFSVCNVCTTLIHQGHAIYHKIEELQAKLIDLKKDLKETIVTSRKEKANQRQRYFGNEDDTMYSELDDYFFQENDLPELQDTHEDDVKVDFDFEPDPSKSSSQTPPQKKVVHDETSEDSDAVDDPTSEQNFDYNWMPGGISDAEFQYFEEVEVKPNVLELQDNMIVVEAPDASQDLRRSSRPRKSTLKRKSGSENSSDNFHSENESYEVSKAKSKCNKKSYTPGGGECSICGVHYQTSHRLKEHESLHSYSSSGRGMLIFRCEKCLFVCKTKKGLLHHDFRIHKIPEEKHSSKSLKGIKKNKVADNMEFRCSLCNVAYKTLHRMKEHEDLHTREDVIQCKFCNFVCLVDRGLKIHVTKNHPEMKTDDNDIESIRRETRSKESIAEKNPKNNDSLEDLEKMFKCEICDVSYALQRRFQEHMRLHDDPTAIKCTECPFVCISSKHLKAHYSEMHLDDPFEREGEKDEGPFNCDLCPAVYHTSHRFQEHEDLHRSETSVSCLECCWPFPSEDLRDRHFKRRHNSKTPKSQCKRKYKGPYLCEHCPAQYKNRYRFKEHVQIFHRDKLIKCDLCQKPYENEQFLKDHRRICKGPREENSGVDDASAKNKPTEFPCHDCSAVFPKKEQLRFHKSRAHSKTRNICKVCGYKSHGPLNLRLHMQKHTKEKLYMCEICSNTFVSPGYLQAHKRKEHHKELGMQPIKCGQCDMLFPTNSILKYHVKKVHEKEFKYTCDICGRGFLFASILRNHAIIHSTSRDQICQICGAAYVHNRVLMSHMKNHHPKEFAAMKGIEPPPDMKDMNEKGPHICKYCNKEFAMRWNLLSHLKTHTEIFEKYKCNLCGKGYASQAAVKRHEESAHLGASYECPKCKKSFPCKDYLRYHMKNHCKKDLVKMEPGSQTDESSASGAEDYNDNEMEQQVRN